MLKVILNPYANRWGAKKQQVAIEMALQAAGLEYDLHLTTHKKNATEVAKEAAESGNYTAIVTAGGDGTLNEVVNGLIQAAGDDPTMPLGVLPVGTGNDMADMIGLPREIEEGVALLKAANTRQIDAGQINGHYFHNNAALAMEPLVTIENINMKRLSGTPRYVVALIKALFKLDAWDMEVEWDGGNYNGKVILFSVANGPRTGSTFMMAPNAKIDDGLFDFVIVPEIPWRTIFNLLPKLFTGKHIEHPKVQVHRSSWIKIASSTPTPAHADGEMVSEGLSEIVYELDAGRITLIG